MKKSAIRFLSLLIIILISFSFPVNAEKSNDDITILFTHDLHSHFLSSVDENGASCGGYARIMTAINEQKAKNPNALLVDGGDFSMGSLFQTAFSSSALELKLMGEMGYDVTTLGNHEFDYLPTGLANMLNVASEFENRPQIVLSNYTPKESEKELIKAFENYGVEQNYTIIERGGVPFVIFGIFGFNSHEYAPNSGMNHKDPVKIAEKTVKSATEYCKKNYKTEPVLICLSHSGTEDGKGEDYDLAKQVDGIDVIVSGHSHSKLEEPIVVNDTIIVSANEYGKNLGVVTLNSDKTLKNYELIEINDSVKEDKRIAGLVEDYKNTVEKDYLNQYGMKFDEVLVNNAYKFDTVDEVYATQHDSNLGNLFADCYKRKVEEVTGENVDVALTAAGVIRETIPTGNVKVSDIFDAASLGVGTEGELIKVFVTGKDLKTILEVDASVQPLMKEAQLFFSGVEYSYNKCRMIFNKVDYARLYNWNIEPPDEDSFEIEDDELYSVVTGMYVGQMLGSVEKSSFGLLKIVPRDKDGNPIASEDLVNFVVKDKDGKPLKEWYAIASGLQEATDKSLERHSKGDNRKKVYSSINPINLLKNANVFTFVALAVVNLLIFIIVFIIYRKKQKTAKSK